MRNIFTIFLIVLIASFLSCQQNVKKLKIVSKNNKSSKLTGTKNLASKTATINFPCAVVIYPSDKAISKLKKSYSEEDYNTIVDDNQNYMNESLTFLDSVKTNQIQRESSGSVLFKTASGKIFEMKLDTLSWAILLFNGIAKPISADMTVFADNYRAYMK